MATLDIFNNDAFQLSQLTQTIVDLPRVPTQIGDSGLFQEYGINTLTMMIERQGSALKLIPTAPRGGVGEPSSLTSRKLFPIAAVHIPQRDAIMADIVQGVRAFGSETEVQTLQKIVAQKQKIQKDQIDLTLEYHRIKALQGQVLDADGTTVLWNYYDMFGMTQETVPFNIATANTTGVDFKALSRTIRRKIQTKLGGRSFTRIIAIVSQGFFDKLTDHDAMKAAWDLWNAGGFGRTQQTGSDFEFAGVVYREYVGGTSAGDFVADGFGYAYPEGVTGLFQTAFAPGDYMDTVNTIGSPYYSNIERMKFDKGVELESQSNPIHLVTLPETIIKLTAAAS